MTHEEYFERIGKKHVRQVERLLDDEAAPVLVNDFACVACGGVTSARFWLCSACKKEFGGFKDWPDWLRFLKNEEQNRRRLVERETSEGVVLEADLPEDVELDDFPLYDPPGAFGR